MKQCILILILISLWSCSSSEPPPAVPLLPPAEGLNFSVAFFANAVAQNSPSAFASFGEQHNDHFQQARVRAENLGVYPQAVLGRAFSAIDQLESQEPQFNNGGYEWTSRWSFNGGQEQTSILRGEIQSDQVDWELSTAGEVWLRGTTGVDDSTSGVWIVHNTALAENPAAIQVDWRLNQEGRFLEMIYLQPGHSKIGSELTMDVDLSTHIMTFVDASQEDALTVIGWNDESQEGILRAFDYHNAVDACWNNALIDFTCSPEF